MIAIDSKGDIAAGTSTNGAIHKVPGLDFFFLIKQIINFDKMYILFIHNLIHLGELVILQ